MNGKRNGKTTAKLKVTNGPTIGLKVQSTIYYRWGENGYYTMSKLKASTSVELSASVRKQLAGAEVDRCTGTYTTTYLGDSIDSGMYIGTLKRGQKYKELKEKS